MITTSSIPDLLKDKKSSQNYPYTQRKKNGGDVKSKDWIKGAIKHPGALHKELHVPMDKKIPEKKLQKAMHSKDPTLRKRANLAKTLDKMHDK